MLLLIYCFSYGRLVYNYLIKKFCITQVHKTFENLFCNLKKKKYAFFLKNFYLSGNGYKFYNVAASWKLVRV